MTLNSHTPRKVAFALAISACLSTFGGAAMAQDKTSSLMPIYGSELMSDPERSAYQTKMRSLKTEPAREAFRLEHHEEMKIRATARGVTLPNDPPAKGLGIQGTVPQGLGQGGPSGNAGGMGSGSLGGGTGGGRMSGPQRP